MKETGSVRYMLRRVVLRWRADELIAETIAYCRKHSIDEIMWIDESPEFYHGLLTRDEVKERAAWIARAGRLARRAGIVSSVDIVTTLGHGDYGDKPEERHPGISLIVNHTGARSASCPCPLSPVWQKVAADTYRAYAAARPARIWANDDFRSICHGIVTFGCYCDLHLKEFSRLVGRPVRREQLVKAILRPDRPHPWRALWFSFQEEVLCRTAAMLRETVQEVSPKTQLGWMSTTPFLHELEGRGMNAQLKAFAGRGAAAVRLCTTRYHEDSPRSLLIEDEALKKALPQLPEGTLRCTEIESMPHSLYTKSAAWLRAQIAWACVLNAPNQTLHLFDCLGTPPEMTRGMGTMLRTGKKQFEALTRLAGRCPEFRGVGLLSHPYSAAAVHTSTGRDFWELQVKETGWADVLRAFGLPIVCSDGEPVSAVTGQAFRRMTAARIRRVLARGVLLDLSALKLLHELGFGEFTGVRIAGEMVRRSSPIGGEELTDPSFGGGPGRYTWTYAVTDDGRVAVLETLPGARVVSRLTDPDGKAIGPAVVLYDNVLGGRVAVFPYDLSGRNPDAYIKGSTTFFYSEYRKLQIQAIVRWLGRETVPLIVRAAGWVLPHRADGKGCTLLAAMNINYDPWRDVTMECSVAGRVRRVKLLDPVGKWSELPSRFWKQQEMSLIINIRKNVPPLRLIGACLEISQ